ncbi:DsbA family protein [Chitinivibrio alkaliphilus]|uniref:Thioredoxin-like domain protein n=1 Tax=Chitinivibrio alkaliphilus ACht1 TaxID=1313304 RepID=U7D7C8_9BACT|nr:thioredoxin domain-containing protein [Chitinivibrio alkaliphilus]ERP31823.1 thioredoxin-like domain protein [Chitinivibrio alkaliphilus ACht1]
MKMLCLVMLCLGNVLGDVWYPDSLSSRQQNVYDSVIATVAHPQNDGMLKSFLETDELARRLANYAAWQSHMNYPTEFVTRRVSDRISLFIPSDTVEKHSFSLPEYILGDPQEGVQVVVFVSSNCPHCKRYAIPLYEEIRQATGDAISYAALPINLIIADRGLIAAARMGFFWELFTAYGDIRGRIEDEELFDAVEDLGYSLSDFVHILDAEEQKISAEIERNRTQAESAGLEFVPTFFINGREYTGAMDSRWILDYIDFISER